MVNTYFSSNPSMKGACPCTVKMIRRAAEGFRQPDDFRQLSTASTGAVPRSSRSTDLLPEFRSLKSPGFDRGFLLAENQLDNLVHVLQITAAQRRTAYADEVRRTQSVRQSRCSGRKLIEVTPTRYRGGAGRPPLNRADQRGPSSMRRLTARISCGHGARDRTGLAMAA
jgi:hypothetical protein